MKHSKWRVVREVEWDVCNIEGAQDARRPPQPGCVAKRSRGREGIYEVEPMRICACYHCAP